MNLFPYEWVEHILVDADVKKSKDYALNACTAHKHSMDEQQSRENNSRRQENEMWDNYDRATGRVPGS